MINGSHGATALVGMPGFVVGAQELSMASGGSYVETPADLVGCAGCGTARLVTAAAAPRCVICRSRAADGAGVGQAPVALPRAGVRGRGRGRRPSTRSRRGRR